MVVNLATARLVVWVDRVERVNLARQILTVLRWVGYRVVQEVVGRGEIPANMEVQVKTVNLD